MTLILTSPPAAEPLSLTEAKAHLRVDGTDEDTLISSLVTAARVHVETSTRRALLTQGWTLALDDWPARGLVEIPLAPLQAMSGIEIYDEDGVPETLDADAYEVDAASLPPRILRRRGHVWPRPGLLAGGIHIDLTVGYGDTAADVPEPLRQAVRLLAAHWFEHREPVILGDVATRVPDAVEALLAPFRPVRL
jgi:uncharacterized phiE125 gp8 family phage protein